MAEAEAVVVMAGLAENGAAGCTAEMRAVQVAMGLAVAAVWAVLEVAVDLEEAAGFAAAVAVVPVGQDELAGVEEEAGAAVLEEH